MTTQAQLIEDVVQSVLQELRRASGSPGSCDATPPAVAAGLTIDDAVVTEATLASRLGSTSEVVFAARTVLTPTARDYLRSNNVSWTRSGSAGAAGIAVSKGPRIVATHSTVAVGSAFNKGSDLVRIGVEKAGRVVIDAVGDGVVLVLTALPHSLAIELNRSAEIRAIALDQLCAAAREVRENRANCVCAKPNGRSKDELKKLARVISNCRVAR